jgi:hypothetical protein
MHRMGVVRDLAGLAFLALLAVLSGCAGQLRAPATVTTGAGDYPRWVRMVPLDSGGMSYYVGIASGATDLESGVVAAEEDARVQASREAQVQFLSQFDQALQGSGSETSSDDRFEFRNLAETPFLAQARAVVRRDSLYTRPCAAGAEGKGTGSATGLGASRVCEVYVLMSVKDDELARVLNEALVTLRKEAVRSGQAKFVKILDWMLGSH